MSFKVNPNSKCGALWYCSHWLPFVGGWCVPTPVMWLAVLLPAAECALPPVDGRLDHLACTYETWVAIWRASFWQKMKTHPMDWPLISPFSSRSTRPSWAWSQNEGTQSRVSTNSQLTYEINEKKTFALRSPWHFFLRFQGHEQQLSIAQRPLCPHGSYGGLVHPSELSGHGSKEWSTF